MNHQNQIQIQQSHGDSNSDFGNRSSLYLNINQPSNMAGAGGVHQHPPYAAVPTAKSPTSSTTIMSRFESPASAFYATERCMGLLLPQYDDSQLVNPNPNLNNPSFTSHFSRLNDSEFPLYQSDPTFLLSNTLHAMVKPQFTPLQYSLSPDKSNLPPINDASLPYKGNQDHTVGLIGSYNLHVDHHLNFSCNQDKLSPTLSSPASVSTTTVSGSNGTVVSSKTRIRWTQDLHDKFVECVNRLGGAEKATPKAILKLMDSDGLTIFHVKSHLQKYRIAKYMPDSAQGKSDKITHVEEDVHRLDAKTGLQIREALQLQLDVQRRLHEQLEIQRKLQLRIEEQGRQLKMMFDQQQKTSNDLLNTQNLSSTTNDDDASNSIKDVDSFFPSKIS